MTHSSSASTRSALRRARRRQRRNRVAALLAVGVLVAVLVTVYVATRDSPAPSGSAAAGLLVQPADPERDLAPARSALGGPGTG